jgi:hypothetical protein
LKIIHKETIQKKDKADKINVVIADDKIKEVILNI